VKGGRRGDRQEWENIERGLYRNFAKVVSVTLRVFCRWKLLKIDDFV
jgi:hypothetical protein